MRPDVAFVLKLYDARGRVVRAIPIFRRKA